MMHVRYDDNKLKMELIYILSASKLNEWKNSYSRLLENGKLAMLNNLNLNVKRRVNLDEMYDNLAETNVIVVNKNRGKIKFTKKFPYLKSVINYLIDDTINMLNWMNRVPRVIGVLKLI